MSDLKWSLPFASMAGNFTNSTVGLWRYSGLEFGFDDVGALWELAKRLPEEDARMVNRAAFAISVVLNPSCLT